MDDFTPGTVAGRKYVIEIDDEYINESDTDTLYRVKGFKSLVLDRVGLKKLTPLDVALEQAFDRGYKLGQEEKDGR